MKRLRALATKGLDAVPPSEFGNLAATCRAEMLDTGDARYAVLTELFRGLEGWWGQTGAVPLPLAQEIDRLLRQRIGAILDADSAADGAAVAEGLLIEIEARELPQSEWFSSGLVAARHDRSSS